MRYPRMCITGVMTAVLILGAGCSCSTTTFTADRWVEMDPIDVSGLMRLEVRLPNGRIELKPSDDGRVHVTAREFAHGASPAEAEENLGRVALRAELSDAQTFLVTLDYPPELRTRSPGADVELAVPVCAATLDTHNGRVQVDDWRGALEIDTANGAIQLTTIEGDVSAKTSNGHVDLEHIQGNVDVGTSNGTIVARGVQGNCEFDTSNGKVRADVTPPPDGFVRIDTSNGAVTLTLPRDLGATFDCSTSNGGISTEFHDVRYDSASGSGHGKSRVGRGRFAANVNGGGCEVSVHTSNGTVTLVME